ncbi:MAG: hypothetical protein CL489_00780 [Acidobacteria bacterium]|nr:hypothetical protein [Acidobacteriota bacterium]
MRGRPPEFKAIANKDYTFIPQLAKSMLNFLDLRVQIQIQEFYNTPPPKQLKFKGERFRLPQVLRASLVEVWNNYPNNRLWQQGRMYAVFGWLGKQGFSNIYNGHLSLWNDEWYEYKYVIFIPIPEPPSWHS